MTENVSAGHSRQAGRPFSLEYVPGKQGEQPPLVPAEPTPQVGCCVGCDDGCEDGCTDGFDDGCTDGCDDGDSKGSGLITAYPLPVLTPWTLLRTKQ